MGSADLHLTFTLFSQGLHTFLLHFARVHAEATGATKCCSSEIAGRMRKGAQE
jgi:hypothetical protein